MTELTPGLTISEDTTLERARKCPHGSEILVGVGDNVTRTQPVAKVEVKGPVHTLFAAATLGVPRSQLLSYTKVEEGERVNSGQMIARATSVFGLFESIVVSPVDGIVESMSKISGQVVVREGSGSRELPAYLEGCVTGINEGEVMISSRTALVQGVFGLGGEVLARLVDGGRGPEEVLDAEHVPEEVEGKILLGGARVTPAALDRLVNLGAKGLVAGSVRGVDLMERTGGELNLAATGEEDLGLTLVITEGFGDLSMSPRAHSVLGSMVGQVVSMSGITQVRAGVVRPEVLGPPSGAGRDEAKRLSIAQGTQVRITRGEHFGVRAPIVEIPVEERRLETGATGFVYVVELEDGRRIPIPRPNVEL